MTLENTYPVPCIYESLRESRNVPDEPLTVSVPGSKSITNRALLAATLAEGTSTLRGVLFSDDSGHFLKCIQDLGFETKVYEKERIITVKGQGGIIPRAEASLYVGSAGTAARFLTAFLGLSRGVYHMDASEQMRRRPMAPLLNSLQQLGCEVTYDAAPSGTDKSLPSKDPGHFPRKDPDHFPGKDPGHFPGKGPDHFPGKGRGHFPFVLHGHGFQKNDISVNIDESSQFLSALLIVSCLCEEDFTTRVEGSHGMAYIEMTLKMMEQFGVRTTKAADRVFLTRAGQHYTARDYQIEPDVSAACYFYAMCPLLNVPVLVNHVHFDSLQGDVAFIGILERMGCRAEDTPEGILLNPPADGILRGITADMSACSDQAITLAAIAPFADSPVTVRGIGHIRLQESDRMGAITAELTKLGIRCEMDESSITVYPGAPAPSTVDTYEDHRMAMGFSLTGLRSPGIVISNPACCRKTFADYFEVLENAISFLRPRS